MPSRNSDTAVIASWSLVLVGLIVVRVAGLHGYAITSIAFWPPLLVAWRSREPAPAAIGGAFAMVLAVVVEALFARGAEEQILYATTGTGRWVGVPITALALAIPCVIGAAVGAVMRRGA